MSIFLVGFMGCGKSKTCELLSKKLELPLISLDDEIQKNTKMTINEIFGNLGEDNFRKIETQMLKKYIDRENIILDMGSGVFIQETNRNILKNKRSVFLNILLNFYVKDLKKREKDQNVHY